MAETNQDRVSGDSGARVGRCSVWVKQIKIGSGGFLGLKPVAIVDTFWWTVNSRMARIAGQGTPFGDFPVQ